MVTLLSYFDSKIGPCIYLTYPEIELTEDLDAIKAALDIKDSEGFMIIKDGMLVLNYMLYIASPLARGREEMLLLSYIITETEPNEKFYKDRMMETVHSLKTIPDLYKAFYPVDNSDESLASMKIIRSLMQELDHDLRMRDITTTGYRVKNTFFNSGNLPVPVDLELIKTEREIKSYLIVYKKERDDSFSFKGYPILSKNVYKVEVFTDEINIGMVTTLTTGFKKFLGGRIIYTSGLCVHKSVCSFELYFEYNGDKENVNKYRDHLKKVIKSKSDIYPTIIWSIVQVAETNLLLSDKKIIK